MGRPSAGSAQWATRHGCRVCRARPWMADRGGPTKKDRTKGARAFGYFAPGGVPLFKVTRCKSETDRSRDPRNGYVHQQEPHRRSDRYRRQASSHSLIRGQQGKMRRLSRRYREQAHSYSLIRVHQGILIWLSGRHRWQASSHNLILVIPSSSSAMRPPSRTRFALHLHRNASVPTPPDDRHQKPIATKYYIRHIIFVINTALHR